MGAQGGRGSGAMTKPAMLQINTAGAWRNVCEFDVADTECVGETL